MPNTIGIRREDLSKKGEKRVALVPQHAEKLTQAGHRLLVQPAIHPDTKENKRAFPDLRYEQAGAEISEDLTEAQVIFGLKEIDPKLLEEGKTYLFFSHTHKGQRKNRRMLRTLVKQKATAIDYELITDAQKRRVVTAFTYFAGYAGMIDSLWALGQRLSVEGIMNPFYRIPQAIEKEDLGMIKSIIRAVGGYIQEHGTPEELPPLITAFLGNGKTSTGAREIYSLLPVQEITLEELPEVFQNGSRKQVYQLLLDIPEMFRIKADAPFAGQALERKDIFQHYFQTPKHFESNLEEVFPYCSMMMNCIIWAPEFPRLLSLEDTQTWYQAHQTLKVIGDITCDPEGAIQFSKETWIDDPVFIYDPASGQSQQGFEGEGIAVMAVTNLPCEFSADASSQFSDDLAELLPAIAAADYDAESPAAAGLPPEVQRATLLWKGEFVPDFAYMADFI